MRVMVPDRINELADLQLPYLVFNKQKQEWELGADAPPEVVKAREEYLEWWADQKNK